jgi:ABC-type phosphate transport system substrate-binding protein
MEELALTMQGVRKSWNEPPLRMTAMINPPLSGNANITVVRRNDSSGTTFAFTDALNRAVGAARSDGGPVLWKFGASSLPAWQNGTLAGQGTGGVIALLQNRSNSIGYAEYGQALAAAVRVEEVSLASVCDRLLCARVFTLYEYEIPLTSS